MKGTRGGDYKPRFEIEECDPLLQGTTIILKGIKRNSSFNKEELAVSLSKLFSFFDDGFKCYVHLNDDDGFEIDSKLKYESIENIEFEWPFPDFNQNIDDDYTNKSQISGKIISTEKPLKPGLRGVTLFANGRLVNEPEFFGVAESSHGFSYLTGWLDVDFVDEREDDVIATNRQSLNWDEPDMPELRLFLKKALGKVERDRREKPGHENMFVLCHSRHFLSGKKRNGLLIDFSAKLKNINFTNESSAYLLRR